MTIIVAGCVEPLATAQVYKTLKLFNKKWKEMLLAQAELLAEFGRREKCLRTQILTILETCQE